MQTENAQQEKVVAQSAEDRIDELQVRKKKNHDKLPTALQEELNDLLEERELKRERGALVHNLAEAADKWGRKGVAETKKSVGKHVHETKLIELGQVNDEQIKYQAEKKSLEAEAKKQMQNIQEWLNTNLANLKADCEGRQDAIRKRYKDVFVSAEKEMGESIDVTLSIVEDFIAELGALLLEQLRELDKTGAVEVGEGAYVVAPWAVPEKQ